MTDRLNVFVVAAGLMLAAGVQAAEERQALSLVPVQALCTGSVEATGRLCPLYTARLGSRLTAAVVAWGVDEAGQPLDVGMRVKAGQTLFSVRTDTFQVRHNLEVANLGVVQARVSELEARLKNAQVDEQRYQRLVEVDQTVPRKKLEDVRLDVATLTQQLAAAQAQVKVSLASVDGAKLDLHDSVVLAPFDGVITKRMKGLGDYLTGAPLVEVLELTTVDRLEAELSLPEAFMGVVQPGKTVVTLHSPLLKSPLEVPVSRVIPQIDAAHGTFVFRAAIPTASAIGLVPGAFVSAQVTLPAVVAGADSVLVPLRALIPGADGKTAVFVAVDGKMQRRVVAVESKLTEGAVIRGDLKPGMQVLTGSAELLQDGAALPADVK